MNLKTIATKKLKERGVEIEDIALIVYELQKKYNHNLTLEYCIDTIDKVIDKREVINAILTGIGIDEATEKNCLGEINAIIKNDDPLYGIDEILALSVVNVYGSIALTNFGYLDKVKPGIIGELDDLGKEKVMCHTFLDDIVCAIASAAASKIAHENGDNLVL